ncbi:MAG: hypothetical protein ACI9WU_002996 [Myxococcota bacterium]
MIDRQQLQAAGVLLRKGDVWLLAVHVQPGAKKTESAGLHGDRLKVRLAAPPVDGKANKVLIAWVADAFGIKKAAVTLLRGHASRQKTLELVLP